MKNVKYENAPDDISDALKVAEPIDDFLPSPEYFAEALAKEKISLNIDAKTVARFRTYARKNGLKYQALMNQVLSSYADKRL
ncbi:MAG: BrnA antitoxin family protein [Oscillospiraceae bacterium]|nr:BrnA antitoxin family protein [Oscillospiraceae bacterium]